MANTRLTRTLGTATNRKKFTISTWFKLGTSPVEQYLFSAGSGTSFSKIGFNGSGYILIFQKNSDTKVAEFSSNALLRDPASWYNLVVAYDTTLATAADRQKVYLNGIQQTSFDTTNPPINTEFTGFNNNIEHKIGTLYDNTSYFNGLMANVEFVDGQQLTPAYFGSTDSTTGIWTPQASSTISNYGVNGFKLAMDTTSPGADTSGKGNTFTPSGTPTLTQGNPQNNWCTFNSIYKSQETLAYGNTASSLPSSNKFGGVASMGVNTGKWYAEFKMNSGSSSDSTAVGIYGNPITASNNDQGVGKENNSLSYNSNGQKGLENSFSSYGASYTTGNVIGVALDMTSATKNITFYKDGASQGNITFNLEQGNEYEGFMFMAANSNTASIGSDWWANFGEGFFGTTAAGTNADGNGQGLFAYAVPSGYYALNTKNLEAYG